MTACWGTPGKRLFLRASTASTLVAKGRRAAKGVAAAALFALNLACYYLGISKMLSFVGRGDVYERERGPEE